MPGEKRSKSLKEDCAKLIKKVGSKRKLNPEMKVIIAGGPLDPDYSAFAFQLEDEVRMYNSLIEDIKDRLHVTEKEIFYKPHPRVPYQFWQLKKEKLHCQVYPYDDISLIDFDLAVNDNVKAVFSYCSDSVVVAQANYGKKGYFIDARNKRNRFTLNILLKLCNHFGIDSFPVRDIPE